MDLSSVRLVAVDLDGTLLNSKHELSIDFFPLLQKLRAKGIHFVVASGRQYYNIYERFEEMADDIIFIAENGGIVMYQQKELLSQSMNPLLTRSLIGRAQAIPGVYSILCGKKNAYIDNDNPEFLAQLSKYYARVQRVENIMNVDDDEFLKIALCDLQGAETNSYPLFKAMDDIQVKVSGKIWVDLSHKLAHKGKALQHIQQKFNIPPNQTMAFGDYLNDIEMLQESFFSFAMENAHNDVKSVANHRAKSNDDNGVIEVLNLLV